MDEDNNMVDNNDANNQAKTKTELDVEKHLLGTTVRLSDGTDGRVFGRNGRSKENLLVYSCHLCGVANLTGERVLQVHIAGRKHQTRLNQPMIDAVQFRSATNPKIAKVQMHIAPGEPVPPGMENEVKPVAELQATIDRFREGPMVGLEYIMELTTPGSKEPSYHCVLCDKKGDPRTVIVHITSYIHRMKFLEKHYPTVINELAPYRGQRGGTKEIINRAIQTVCEAIEDHHGRLTPNVHDSADYARNKMKYLQEVLFEKHFDERTGPKFVEVIDKKMLQEQMAAANGTLVSTLVRDPSPPVVQAPQKKSRPARADRKSLDSISSMDSVQSISSDDSNGNARSGVPRTLSGRPSGASAASSRHRPAVHHSSSREDRRPARSPQWRRSPARRSPARRSPIRRRSPLPFRRSPDRGRHRSPPSRRRSRSPPPRRRVSRSPVRRRSPTSRHDRSPMRFGGDRKSRSPETEKRKTLPSPKELSLQASEIAHERYKWEKYRCSLEIAVAQLEKTFKEYEKNPEKHPMYPEEWKKFWNRRYKELQAEKKDPSKHDFKPEWIGFWTKRMKELHDDDIDKKKAEIKKKLNLPDEETDKFKELKEQYTVKVNKKKRSVEPIESSEDEKISLRSKPQSKAKNIHAKRSRSPISDDDFEERSRHSSIRHYSRERERERSHYKMASYMQEQQDYDEWARNYYGPNKKVFVRTEFDAEDTSPLNFVSVCRLLTALEDYLGSLGPKVIDLLSKSLALEKVKANSADELLLNEDNCMFLETVKEKLKGHLMADMIEPPKIAPVKKAIKNIASLIHEASKKEKQEPEPGKAACSAAIAAVSAGGNEKAAIAQKLAAALVAQGKTDFTSEELEELINVYVAMAEASKEKEKPVTASTFLNEVIPSKSEPEKRPETSSRRSEEAPDDGNALEGLTDSDLQTLLQNFKDLSNEEQLHLISHLKKLEKTDPVRVEKLRRYVNLDDKPSNSRARDEYYDDEPDQNYDADNQHYNDDDDAAGSGNFEDDIPDFNNGANPSSNPGNPIKPLVSGGYGSESPVPFAQKKLIDSEDEDDYTYDDVVRAASKNVIIPPTNSNSNSMQMPSQRADFTSDNYDGNSNFSRASNEHGTKIDTQKIIANLMGSLPGKASSVQGSQGHYNNPISTIGQSETSHQNTSFYDSTNPSYGSNPYSGSVGGPNQAGPPGGPYMNQQNRPQFAPIQTANTSVNSMPYYYQQQMRAQQPQMNPRMPQQQMNNFAGGPAPPRPPMQNTFPWQQGSGQRQPGGGGAYQYENNYY